MLVHRPHRLVAEGGGAGLVEVGLEGVVLGVAAAPQQSRPQSVGVAVGQLLDELGRLVGRQVEHGARLGGGQLVAQVQVEQVAHPLAEHVGGVPQQAGDGGVLAGHGGVGGGGELVLGVVLAVADRGLPRRRGAGGAHDDRAERRVARRDGAVHVGEDGRRALARLRRRDAGDEHAVVDVVHPGVGDPPEGACVTLAVRCQQLVVAALPFLGGRGRGLVVCHDTLPRCSMRTPPTHRSSSGRRGHAGVQIRSLDTLLLCNGAAHTS